jgi:hypothetical protein
VRLLMNQESTGSVNASAEMDADIVEDQAVSGAIASANNLTVGGDTATILNATRQNATGASVTARSDLYVGYGDRRLGQRHRQRQLGHHRQSMGLCERCDRTERDVDKSQADSYVTLGDSFAGFASAGAYGVGNQATVANVGSDTVLDVAQSNSGGVTANAGSRAMAAVWRSPRRRRTATASPAQVCTELRRQRRRARPLRLEQSGERRQRLFVLDDPHRWRGHGRRDLDGDRQCRDLLGPPTGRLRLQPTVIAHDQPCQRMANLDEEAKRAVFLTFIGI